MITHNASLLSRRDTMVAITPFLLAPMMAPTMLHAADREAGLYDPAPPPGSAFLRIFNAGSSALNARIGRQKLPALGIGSVSAYAIVRGGIADIQLNNGGPQKIGLAAGSFVTVTILPDGKTQRFVDPPGPNPTKASLTLYNLTAAPLDLKTPDGKQVILSAVAPGLIGQRLVNAAQTGLLVQSAASKALLAPMIIERGAAFSVFAWQAGQSLRASAARAATSRA